ncbi:MAG: bacterial transcriptional activator domain-containing protein [Ardenticatenaceae bacterium]|nr:bacterial transcriptional activator domain-containing protein [Ardenticatenaceae bacterium]
MFDVHPVSIIGPGTQPPVLVALLGTFRLTLQGALAPIGSGSKAETLLSHLALARQRRVPRLHLLEHLWPDCESTLAGQSLNSLTYRLNKLASKSLDGAELVTHEDGYYSLNTESGVEVDIDCFDTWSNAGKRLLQSGHEAEGLAHCQRALALYRGDLCGDSSICTVIERERLRAACLDLLACLADYYYARRNPAEAMKYIHRLLAYDPCREDAHRQAMRCYVRLGLRAQALRQYQICSQALRVEFNATPEPATIDLYDTIRLDPASV